MSICCRPVAAREGRVRVVPVGICAKVIWGLAHCVPSVAFLKSGSASRLARQCYVLRRNNDVPQHTRIPSRLVVHELRVCMHLATATVSMPCSEGRQLAVPLFTRLWMLSTILL
eukprot:3313452-Pleurochrysis_carterae.AAC.1